MKLLTARLGIAVLLVLIFFSCDPLKKLSKYFQVLPGSSSILKLRPVVQDAERDFWILNDVRLNEADQKELNTLLEDVNSNSYSYVVNKDGESQNYGKLNLGSVQLLGKDQLGGFELADLAAGKCEWACSCVKTCESSIVLPNDTEINRRIDQILIKYAARPVVKGDGYWILNDAKISEQDQAYIEGLISSVPSNSYSYTYRNIDKGVTGINYGKLNLGSVSLIDQQRLGNYTWSDFAAAKKCEWVCSCIKSCESSIVMPNDDLINARLDAVLTKYSAY